MSSTSWARPERARRRLLERTIQALKPHMKIGVIEGDIVGSDDAERIGALDMPVVQINTGGACHLDANMISEVLDELPLRELDMLIIENVGNLVCPAEFRVGEDMKMMVLSSCRRPRQAAQISAHVPRILRPGPEQDRPSAVHEHRHEQGPERFTGSQSKAEDIRGLLRYRRRDRCMGHMVTRAQIVVKGIVQGVGFRPFVYNLAETLGLKGYVTNASRRRLDRRRGAAAVRFCRKDPERSPSAFPDHRCFRNRASFPGYQEFSIHRSIDQTADSPFTLDLTRCLVCDDCLREMLDPSDRRFLYPFINCINCGPRYSITLSVPYDRPNTTMAAFTMCPDCLREYQTRATDGFTRSRMRVASCGPKVEFRVQSSEFGVQGK